MQENLSLESVPPSSIPVLLHVFVGNSDNDIGSKLDSCTDDKKKKKAAWDIQYVGWENLNPKSLTRLKKETSMILIRNWMGIRSVWETSVT